ncbi:ATP-binding protein [Alcanivorax sp.]|uniref:ATP-binding protein n=1 Tax=Alcanivorax sp. TaxID=1872427 RepID=UPI003BACDBA9
MPSSPSRKSSSLFSTPVSSTAAAVTQISGRGVGMDVVASEIKQMGGSVTIDSHKGQGTRFIIRLPFTLAMNRALMVKAAEDTYAIPLNQIEGIVRISPFELQHYFEEDNPVYTYVGQDYELQYLGNFVHGTRSPHLDNHTTPMPVLLIRSTEHTVAIVVDNLVGSRESGREIRWSAAGLGGRYQRRHHPR